MGAEAETVGEDPLTGLPGYEAFLGDLERAQAASVEGGGYVSVALVDIDWFGKLNAEHGRALGDRIIEGLARSLCESSGGEGAVYRYGGDAFMVMFEGIEKEQAFLRMEEARRRFEGAHGFDGSDGPVELELSVSCGVAACPDDGTKRAELIRKCSEALYRAKVSGRNKVCLAREEKMVTKTTHYTQGQLEGLSRLAKREGLNEATLLREALDDLLRKHNS